MVDPDTITLENTGGKRLALHFVAAIGLTIGLMIVGDLFVGATPACRWCSQNAFDEGLRKLVVSDDRLGAARFSHQMSIMFLPLLAIFGTAIPALLTKTKKMAALQNFVLVLITLLLTTAIPAPVKAIASRERPGFVHHVVTEGGEYERFASFFSGDTAWAFGFCAVGATLCWLRGYRHTKVMIVVGGIAAFLAGLGRMRADMHWATDVLMGATVGTVVGAGLPLLLHRRVGAPVTAAPEKDATPTEAA